MTKNNWYLLVVIIVLWNSFVYAQQPKDSKPFDVGVQLSDSLKNKNFPELTVSDSYPVPKLIPNRVSPTEKAAAANVVPNPDSPNLSANLASVELPKPKIAEVGSNSPVCMSPATILLRAAELPGVTYKWEGPNGFKSTHQNPVVRNVSRKSEGFYTVSCLKDGVVYARATTYVKVPALQEKKVFPGSPRNMSVSFAIRGKGYLGTGNDGKPLKDFWEFDPVSDTWSRKADFIGTARYYAVAFVINEKAYVGLGFDGDRTNSFYEYDATLDRWRVVAPFPGTGRLGASAFVIDGKGYVVAGNDDCCYLNDCWEYDPVTNQWTQKASFPGVGRRFGTAFSVMGKGYFGTGSTEHYLSDFWEYDPKANKWVSIGNFPGGARSLAVSFSIENKGYLATGYNGRYFSDIWEYDPINKKWHEVCENSISARQGSTAFVINDRCYIGTGFDGAVHRVDMWEF